MESISPMQTPQGALFLCRLPEKKSFVPRKGMLLLDGIQDPGNLGTILRTADALQIPVVLLEGCADPYNHKTVRASMGAVFRSPVITATWQEVQTACARAGIPVAVTALTDRAKDLRQAPLRDMAVVIGSEGQGVRQEILDGTYKLDTDVEIAMQVDYKAIYQVGEGHLVHDNTGFTLTGCDGRLNYHQKPQAGFGLYADYYWYEIGDVICIGDTQVHYFLFPKNGEPVAKIRLAAEEMYKLYKERKLTVPNT